jgi:hypothetical protein
MLENERLIEDTQNAQIPLYLHRRMPHDKRFVGEKVQWKFKRGPSPQQRRLLCGLRPPLGSYRSDVLDVLESKNARENFRPTSATLLSFS